jgi:hypothetical protein
MGSSSSNLNGEASIMALSLSSRSRVITIAGIVVISTAFGLVTFWHSSGVLAAKRAVAGENSHAATSSIQHPNANPVLVELFTSEGCSDCPPADAFLAHLQQDQPVPSANIIALEEHVDYWDHLGWRDRFSSHDLTARQNAYTNRLHLDDNYTPQMIVDGTDQFVGSDSAKALRAVTIAARTPKLPLTLSSLTIHGTQLSGAVSPAASSAPLRDADVYAALVERTSSTRVLKGENGGRTLHHVSTVLALEKIGDAHMASAPLSFSFKLPQDANPADLAVIVFAQRTGQGAILGIVSSAAPVRH